jgi:hypothetical protein
MATATTRLADPLGWIAAHDPLTVVTLADPLVEQMGHRVDSVYVEAYWLPVIGPASVLAARRLAAWLEASPEGEVVVDLEELGRSLGLSGQVTRNAPVVRTLRRLADFGLASYGANRYALRLHVPPLPARYLARLPETLQLAHGAGR